MIPLDNGNVLVQSVHELPAIEGVAELFMDFETQSFDKTRPGNLYFKKDRIASICVTVDEHPHAWYIPIRHTDTDWNLPLEPALRWLRNVVGSCKDWINSGILFDAHFAKADGAEFTGRLLDTVTLAKLIDSDRFEYGLKILCRDWLGIEDWTGQLEAYLNGIGSKNFADAPADILGNYGCPDVINNRTLFRHITKQYDPTMKLAWNNEINLTPVLFDMEEFGMPVDPQELKIEKFKSLTKQINLGTTLTTEVGHEVNPNSHQQVYDVMINQLGLPVLKTNEDEESDSFGNPSFDKEAWQAYIVHPEVTSDPRKMLIVKTLKEARDEAHFCSLFLTTYLELHENGLLHPSYNQCVRTGRMSCREPNAQQLNRRAKALIHPKKGYGIIAADYSQIEFRLIVHYINDVEGIKAFNTDPKTDFHQWVADLCGVKRKPAKCLNFGMGFGAGKKKVIKMLCSDPTFMALVAFDLEALIKSGKIEESKRVQVFKEMCQLRANDLYNTYHERLPGIKATSRRASDVVKARGFVFNLYGRRRHLLPRACYKGFNSIVQSCAADVMKDCTIKLAPRYNKKTRELGIHLFSSVHDENGTMVPLEILHDPEVHQHIKGTLEDSSIKFSIPIITDMGFSLRHWADASADDPVVIDGQVVGGPL